MYLSYSIQDSGLPVQRTYLDVVNKAHTDSQGQHLARHLNVWLISAINMLLAPISSKHLDASLSRSKPQRAAIE